MVSNEYKAVSKRASDRMWAGFKVYQAKHRYPSAQEIKEHSFANSVRNAAVYHERDVAAAFSEIFNSGDRRERILRGHAMAKLHYEIEQALNS